MENKRWMNSSVLVPGMTLVMLAVLCVQMGGSLAHAGTAAQTLALAGLYTLVYGGLLAGYALLEKPKENAVVLGNIFDMQ